MDNETLVKIETTLGDIKVKLYNETPKHRDNFIKLAEDGVYEGTLFHRVIKDFMIQAGDPVQRMHRKERCWVQEMWVTALPAEFVYPEVIFTKKALCPLLVGRQCKSEERIIRLPVLHCDRQSVQRLYIAGHGKPDE